MLRRPFYKLAMVVFGSFISAIFFLNTTYQYSPSAEDLQPLQIGKTVSAGQISYHIRSHSARMSESAKPGDSILESPRQNGSVRYHINSENIVTKLEWDHNAANVNEVLGEHALAFRQQAKKIREARNHSYGRNYRRVETDQIIATTHGRMNDISGTVILKNTGAESQ